MRTASSASSKSKPFSKSPDDAKNTCPVTRYSRTRSFSLSSELTCSTCPTLRAKNSALNNTPTSTPMARLLVAITTMTVAIMTMLDDLGCSRRLRNEDQSKVPIDTMTMTATNDAMGIMASNGLANTTSTSRNAPATNVDKRPRPPDFTLITLCPIMAQPAMPPNRPDTKLAMPWPMHSRFLSLPVSVKSSTMVAVIMVSSNPTTAMANAYGNTIINVSRFSGTSGHRKCGNDPGNSPMSATVGTSTPTHTQTTVSSTIDTSGDGTALVKRGNP